jgi:prephenate dehydrogenase
MFKEITIIGLGFMGASLAGALKSLKADIVINGFDVVQKNIDFCLKNNFIDRAILLNSDGHYCGDAEKKALDLALELDLDIIIGENFNPSTISNIHSEYDPTQSDIAVLCIPPKIILKYLFVHKNFLSKFQLITDIGSIKKEIVSTAKKIGLNNFIGSHPMCGSDKSGAENADIFMFHGKTCIVIEGTAANGTYNSVIENSDSADVSKTVKLNKLNITATDNTSISTAGNSINDNAGSNISVNDGGCFSLNLFEKTAFFWKTLEMEIVYAGADFHDYMVGYSSHLPHIVSFCLSKTVLDAADANKSLNSLKYIASGFKDTTRIAASSENIWTDIFLLNTDNLISSLDNYIGNLNKFKMLLENNDENAINALIAEISKQRKMLN